MPFVSDAGPEDAVEVPDERLSAQLRQAPTEGGLPIVRLRGLAPGLQGRGVRQLDDVIRAAEDGDRKRRLHEVAIEVLA